MSNFVEESLFLRALFLRALVPKLYVTGILRVDGMDAIVRWPSKAVVQV